MPMSEKYMDPKMKRTLEHLKHALVEIIAESGFDGASITEIANRAGCNRATFYAHYRDKQHLLESIMAEIFEDLIQRMQDFPSSDPSNSPMNLKSVFQHVVDYSKFYQAFLGPNGIPHFQNELLSCISNYIINYVKVVTDSTKQEINAEIYSYYASFSLGGMIIMWVKNGMKFSASYMTDQLAQIVNSKPHTIIVMKPSENRV